MAEKRMNMRLADIRIPEQYLGHEPKPEKVEAKKREHLDGGLNYCIAVTSEHVLVDGYAAYRALQQLGVTETGVRIRDVAYVVAAHHPAYPGKTYQWRCKPDTKKNLRPGDHIAVVTRKGVREAIIEGFTEMPAAEAAGMSAMVGRWNPDHGKDDERRDA